MSEILFFFEAVEPFGFPKKSVQELIFFLIDNEKKAPGDISVIFCSDAYLLNINEQYLGHDYYTDIVTFDYVENSVISGDLFISIDRINDNSKQLGVSFDEELLRVIIHGVLHLTGYKDKTIPEKKMMREKENFYLGKAGFKIEER